MEHIKQQLEILLNKKGLGKIAAASRVCYVFERDKREILANKINANALSFKDGKLRLRVSNSSEASEVKLSAEKIKKELNKKLGEDTIKRIETTLTS